jgi:hypothetical protein
MPVRYFLVGTFSTNRVFTLAFDSDAETLEVAATNEGQAPHSWLALNVRGSELSLMLFKRLTTAREPRRKGRTGSTRLPGRHRRASPRTRLREMLPGCPL